MPTLFLHFFLFLFTTTVTNLIPAVHSNCIEAQKQSLLHFKKSLVFYSSRSSKLITWNSSTECCSWLGVTCSTNGSVVGLDLNNESISCSIDNSSSLFQLEHLQSLNLAWNDFNASTIPSAIGKLTELRHLNLSDASFSGVIPIEISHLKRLVVLDLSTTHSSWELKLENPNLGTLIQNLTELTELNLEYVNLSAEGSLSLWSQTISSSLPKLRVLTLYGCNLSGPIHESFARLHSLSMLILDNNNISGPVPKFFANFSSLIYLSLSACNLYGPFPKEIFQIPSLQSVDLSANSELRGSLPEFPKNGSLESLVLYGTKFSGVLPDSIGNLKKLSELDLSHCNFTGAVPKSLANLTQLGFLFLSSNKFSGPINSIQWDRLIKLQSLDLTNNLLYGNIPLSPFSIPLLQRLALSGNHFSGQLLEFSNVSSYLLSELDLSSNSLEGSIPVFIFNLPNLEEFNLSSNNFSGFPDPALFNHNGTNSFQIQRLHLASNKLKTFPNFLKNLSHLTELDLSDNQIPGQIPNWIWGLPLYFLDLSCNKLVSLEAPLPGSTYQLSLDLHSNQIQGQIPLFISGTFLDYSRNNFSSSIPTDIGDIIDETTHLSLSSSNLYGEIPKSICNGSVLVLDLSNNSLSGMIPQCLTQLPSLSVLDLRRNNLTGSIPDTFLESYCQLQTLALSRNQIQGQFPKSLANCFKLEVLDLGVNQITDAFPCPLKTISTLCVLMLRSNKFYGPIGCPETEGTWPQLQIIDLAHNSFSGEIPGTSLTTWQAMMVNEDGYRDHIGYYFEGVDLYGDAVTTISKGLEMDLVKILTIFTLIDFSTNKFNGTIPKEMGQLRSLVVLNLSSNAFTGEIPSSFSNMRSIESLDLSQNHLSGQIPPQFANLTFLSHLNVSYNQLTGRIPTNTQFLTFPNTSFEGNKGLWGPPLTSDTAIVLPPPMLNGSSSTLNSGDEIDWTVISVEVGFTCGFGIVVGSLLFCKRWRKWYYRAMFKILFKIFPQLEHRFGNHIRHVYINQRYWRR